MDFQQCFEYLINSGSNPYNNDSQGKNCLDIILSSGDKIEFLKILIQAYRDKKFLIEDVNHINIDGNSLLMFASRINFSTSIIFNLVEFGDDPNYRNPQNNYNSSLILSIFDDNIQMTKTLLDCK